MAPQGFYGAFCAGTITNAPAIFIHHSFREFPMNAPEVQAASSRHGEPAAGGAPQLERGLGLWSATSMNVANMVGIGPFITIPAFLAAMGGPQALIAWVAAAILVLCDGMVWAELGAALPGSGGSYHFLREIFGRHPFWRILPFLFVWQFLAGGTLELASGFLGAMNYVDYAFPELAEQLAAWHVPGGKNTLAALAALAVAWALCRTIRTVAWAGIVLAGGTLLTVGIVVVAGLANFDVSLIAFPENAFRLDTGFFKGLGGAMLIAVYDYLGYYNICHLGEEVRNPGRTIPRAIVLSVVLVSSLYLVMNTCIIAVVPVQEAMQKETTAIAAMFIERLFGDAAMRAFTLLVLWTVVACVFTMMLGYSRIPLAAARGGDFFPVFQKLHPVKRYPWVSLATLGGLTAVFCYLPLELVINAAVTVRIAVQFIGQIVALHILRTRRPDVQMPFRMLLYPLPSLLALVGWLFVLGMAKSDALQIAAAVLGSGILAFAGMFCLRQRRQRRACRGSGPNGH